jgi:serine/threonine-protein kinase
MPFVEGESLRDRLTREQQLPVDDAVRITREAALALDFAHRRGVIHRDIKPDNILLTDGQALVADFGIARALRDGSSLTQTGMAIGTPAYMSPEQASGERTLDARTDVYALGCVLYEMLAGEPPFTGPNAQAIIARALSETARPLSTVRKTVSPALSAAVAKAMAVSAADRYATAAEFARALGSASVEVTAATVAAVPKRSRSRTYAALGAGVLALALAAGAYAVRRTSADLGIRRIAVLPFENEGSADDEYFADGVADEVRSKLSGIPGIQVTARGSTSQYKRSKKPPKQIGEELGVEYLLSGTVRWSKTAGASRVKVSPELIQVANQSSRWNPTFDRVMSDVFALQTEIATEVADTLGVQLAPPTKARVAEKPTGNLDAYDSYLKGEQISQSMGLADAKPIRAALVEYERAVTQDSTFALAWSAIARAQATLNNVNATPDGMERARVAADRALALSPNGSAGHLAMGTYLRTLKRDYEGAKQQFEAGLAGDPNNAVLLGGAASVERILGHYDDAVAHLRRAATLDPRSVSTARQLAFALHDTRRYAEALKEFDRGLAISPGNLALIQGKATSFVSLGRLDSARTFIARQLQTVDTTALLVRFSLFQEQMWILDPALWPKIVVLRPKDFDNDPGHWGLKVGRTYMLMGDSVRARAYGDSALMAFQRQLATDPGNAQYQELVARALALGGHRTDAVAAAEKSLEMRETKLDASTGPYVKFQVARVLIQAGAYDRALDLVEPLLTVPGSDLTPAYLKLDPIFKPLYRNPRFERLAKR